MNYPAYFDSKNSLKLFGFQDNFKFLSTLYKINNLPKVLMFTGNKGSGKATLVNHFLFSIFDEKNYNKTNFSLLNISILFLKNFFFKIENFNFLLIKQIFEENHLFPKSSCKIISFFLDYKIFF